MRAFFLVLLAPLFASHAEAGGVCRAKNPSDSYYRQVCAGKNEPLCRWDSHCRWSRAPLGTCEAVDPNDAYYRNVCRGKNEALCKWDSHCAWNE